MLTLIPGRLFPTARFANSIPGSNQSGVYDLLRAAADFETRISLFIGMNN